MAADLPRRVERFTGARVTRVVATSEQRHLRAVAAV
jgi:hypothetical protein